MSIFSPHIMLGYLLSFGFLHAALMTVWISLASLFAGDFSGMVPEAIGNTPLSTNPTYSALFAQLGWGSTAVGVLLVLLIPYLRKLIKDKETPADDALVPIVATR